MERYLRMFSGERFVPEAKDYARAESCKSEAKAVAQMNSITDLDKLFRRCIAFVTRGSYGTNAKLWMDRAKELGASPEDIIQLYEIILNARIETPNPNEQAPDNSAIVASAVTETEPNEPVEEVTVGANHPVFGKDSKLKYFARYNVVLSYADKTYAEKDYWSSQVPNSWYSSEGYIGNSVEEVIKLILKDYKDVIYAADIVDDRLIIVGYGYGNFGGSLKSSSYADVADDIIQQSYKEYERGDDEITYEVNRNLHAIKLSIPIWMGNPNVRVSGYDYDSQFDRVTGLSDYKKLIPNELKINPLEKLLQDAKDYDIIAAGKRIHGGRDEGEIPTLLKSKEASANHVFGPYQTKDKGETYYQYGYDGSVLCYVINRDGKWWLSKDFKFNDLKEIDYTPTWEMFNWDARFIAGRVEYSVQDIKSKLIKAYDGGPLDLSMISLRPSDKAEFRVIGCSKKGYFCHDLKYYRNYDSHTTDIIKKYYESNGNAVYQVLVGYNADYKQVPFEFLGIKFTPKLAELELPDSVSQKVRGILNKALGIFDGVTDPTLSRLVHLRLKGLYKNGTRFSNNFKEINRDNIILLDDMMITAEMESREFMDLKDKGKYGTDSVDYFKSQNAFLQALDKVKELGTAKKISPAKLNAFKKALKSYVKELSTKKILYLPSLSIQYNGKTSIYEGNFLPDYMKPQEAFDISEMVDPFELKITYERLNRLSSSLFESVKIPDVPKVYVSTNPNSLSELADGLIQVMEWAKNESRYLLVNEYGVISVGNELESGKTIAKYEVVKLNKDDFKDLKLRGISKAAMLLNNWESKGKIKAIDIDPEFTKLMNPVQDKSLVTKVNNLLHKFITELNKTYGISSYEFKVTEMGKSSNYGSFDRKTTPYSFYSYPSVNDLSNLEISVRPNLETKLFDNWEEKWGDRILKYTGQTNYIAELNKLFKLKELNDKLPELYLTLRKSQYSKRLEVYVSGIKRAENPAETTYLVKGHSVQDVLRTEEISSVDFNKSKLKEIISAGKKDKTIIQIK